MKNLTMLRISFLWIQHYLYSSLKLMTFMAVWVASDRLVSSPHTTRAESITTPAELPLRMAPLLDSLPYTTKPETITTSSPVQLPLRITPLLVTLPHNTRAESITTPAELPLPMSSFLESTSSLLTRPPQPLLLHGQFSLPLSSLEVSSPAIPPQPPETTTTTTTPAETTTTTAIPTTIRLDDLGHFPTEHRNRPSNLIRLGIILPYTGSHPWVLSRTLPAILLAVEKVTNHSTLLSDYTIHVTSQDSSCSETFGPLAAIDMYVNQSADVFFGPACPYSVAPVARFSHFWGIPVLTAGGLVTDLRDKTEYKMLTRVQGPYAKVSEAILTALRSHKWSVLGLLYTDSDISGKDKKRACYFSARAVFYDYRLMYGTKPHFLGFDENRPHIDFAAILADMSKNARGK